MFLVTVLGGLHLSFSIVLVFIFLAFERTQTTGCLSLLIVVFYLTINGMSKQSFPDTFYTKEKVIVSSSPSHQYIEGGVGGNFMLFSG